MSKLYVIPTPIGNLGDITYRAIEVLKQVSFIIAEDTRKSSILLNKYEIKKPLTSFNKDNEHRRVDKLVNRIMQEDAALVTDAGTPGISDPGYLLISRCLDKGIQVECLPGATALIPALVHSGLPMDRFVFEGFLPAKKGRNKRLGQLAEETRTMIFYESPHRIQKTIDQLKKAFGGERKVSISRELTKIHEEVINGTLESISKHLETSQVKGEFVVIVSGRSTK